MGSKAITDNVQVEVETEHLAEQSSPEQGLWVHAYTVTITNLGDRSVQLLSRHWIITNAHGDQEHVRGPGVVGAQPVIKPGEHFTYTSGCPLDTAMGTMHGSFQMVRQDGTRFEAVVAPFTLTEPYALN